MRDEVLAEWIQTTDTQHQLLGYAYVDGGEFSLEEAAFRYNIFLKEMPLALKAIVYGDLPLYEQHPYLLDQPIIIEYHSSFPAFQNSLYYGTPRDIVNGIFHSQHTKSSPF
nr:staygreen family protein [Alkalibacillus haloalkaliphilus]